MFDAGVCLRVGCGMRDTGQRNSGSQLTAGSLLGPQH